MPLTKSEREIVRMKYGGKCAYCGDPLPKNWHADHLEPIQRRKEYIRGKGLVSTGDCDHPQRDTIDNMMPACPPCNLDKHSFDLEYWRRKLQDACGVLARNNSTYRFALKYGLVQETEKTIQFYFEQTTLPSNQEKP